MKNKALITGITGQDGSYLAEFLLDKDYEVHGLIRRSSSFNTTRIDHLYKNKSIEGKKLFLHYSDLTDPLSLSHLLHKIEPDELYNLGAQSHVGVSFLQPDYTASVDALGTLRLLESIKEQKLPTKFYQASSSELFGKVQEIPQTETTPFYPRSPYAVAKTFAFWITKNYRESYNIFASNGILFNHESPRRGETFVTRKITRGLCNISLGFLDCLDLGNLNAKRDWGYAPDFVRGMWKILQHSSPDDFVLSTGKMYSVRDCVKFAARCLGIDIVWEGSGIDEIGINRATGKTIIKIDPRYFRPSEVDLLIGDSSKAKKLLNWEASVSFPELIELMVKSDLEDLQ